MRPVSRLSPVRRRLRVVRRHLVLRRRLLAALLSGVAALAAVRAAEPPPPPTVAVTVAARDLPAGAVLAAGDVTTERFAAGTAPDDLAATPVGRLLAAPVSRGEPLTAVRLVGPGLARAQPDQSVLPVRLSDAGVARLLRPGDEVDLLATDPASGETRVLADGVTVLAVPREVEAASGRSAPGALVVVGVAPEDSLDVTSAWVSQFLTVAWAR
jgi:Flp pilus assembly protein CpaB